VAGFSFFRSSARRYSVKRPKSRALALRSRDYDAMINRVVRLIDEARPRFRAKRQRHHDCDILVDWPAHG